MKLFLKSCVGVAAVLVRRLRSIREVSVNSWSWVQRALVDVESGEVLMLLLLRTCS